MTTLGTIKIENAILCEDIRQEKSEKFILAGIFGGDISVEKVPSQIPLALYLTLVISRTGSADLWVRYSGPGKGSAIFHAKMETTADKQAVSLPIPRADVFLECEGTFKVDVSADEKRWKPLIRKKIAQQDGLWSLMPSNASELPSELSLPGAQGSASPREPSRPGSPKKRQRS